MTTQATTECCGPAPEAVQIEAEPTTGCCASTSDAVAEGQDTRIELELAPETSGCCGDVQPQPENSGCCGSAESEPADCCETGAPGAEVLTGLLIEDATRGLDPAHVTWPYLHPAWLKATESVLPGAKPWHAVARRGEDTVVLPAFVFDAPSLVDADPRTYLGWAPASGESACCSVTSCCTATTDVEAIGEDRFFPAVVLGSPVGFRSEALPTTDDPMLLADLLDAFVPAARAAGVRTIVAPWVADLPDNGALLVALQAHGATVSFGGEDNVLTLEHDSYEAHLASLGARKRRKIRDDQAAARATGVSVTRKDGAELLPLVERIAELVGLNRQKYDGGEGPEEIRTLLTAMIEGKADVRAYVGYVDERAVAVSVTYRQRDRLFVKWVGFDYEALGERSSIYFDLLVTRPLQDAYAEKLAALELGPGGDQAKRLRGARPRAVHTALLVTDAKLAPKTAELQNAFGEARREALGAETTDNSIGGRLLAKFRSGAKAEPIKPVQPEGGCCG